MERPSGVSSARLDSWAASASVGRRRRPATGEELGGLPVAEGDGAGLVQQQRVDVAGRLDRPAGHGQHVVLHQPVHARRCRWPTAARRWWSGSGRPAARRARSATARRRSRSRTAAGSRWPAGRRSSGWPAGCSARSRWASSAGDAPSTRAIIRSMKVSPGLAVICDDDPVGEHLGAAGDRAAVAAGLADDRGGLAGDRRLVDAGDALDDVAVARG